MKPPLYVRVAITTLSIGAFLAGVLLVALGLIFLGNFNFGKNAHLCIFAATVFAPVFVAGCWLFFQLRPSRWSAAWIILSYAVTATAWFLWGIPAANGLIH